MFEMIIAPLAHFLQFILEFYIQLSGSYGWAIILLSLSVTIIMLPIYYLADKIQERDLREKAAMESELDYIQQAVPSSQERYFYTRYLYQRHGYHPIKALRSLIGLAVQVPFFIAAYQMLGHYSQFAGQVFGFIRDLGRPDQLLLSNFNLLPVLMTVLNIASSWMFLQNGIAHKQKHKSGESLQLYGISLLFLLLLYQHNAALVLYWTMNNAFSLLKNLYKNWRYIREHQLFRQLLFWLWPLAYALAYWMSFYSLEAVQYGLGQYGGVPRAELLQAIVFGLALLLLLLDIRVYHKFPLLEQTPEQRIGCRKSSALFYLALLGFSILQAMIYLTRNRAHWFRYTHEIAIIVVAVWLALLLVKYIIFQLYYRRYCRVAIQPSCGRLARNLLFYYVWPAQVLLILYLSIQHKTPSEMSFHYNAIPVLQFLSLCVSALYGIVFYHFSPAIRRRGPHFSYFYLALIVLCSILTATFQLRLFVMLFAVAQQFALILLCAQLRRVLFGPALTSQISQPSGAEEPTPSSRPGLKSLSSLVFLSALALLYLITFLENPVLVYLSDAEGFSYTIQQVLPAIASIGAWLVGTLLLLYLLPVMRRPLYYTFPILAISSWVYSYIYLPFIGKMQGIRFETLEYLYRNISTNLLELAVYAILIWILLKLLRGKAVYILLINILGLAIISTKGIQDYRLSLVASRRIDEQRSAAADEKDPKALLPPGYQHKLSFSKEQQNILVVLFDGFTGPMVPKIFRDYPELKEAFQGFVHYRNNITASAPTFGSLMSMLMGKQFEPESFVRLLQNQAGVTTHKTYNKAYNFLPELLKKEGFDTYHHLSFGLANSQAMDFPTGGDGDYLAYWRSTRKIREIRPPLSFTENLIMRLALFKSAPLFLKPVVYNNGEWLALEDLQIASNSDRNLISSRRAYQTVGRRLALLDTLPELANTNSPHKTYKFIHLQSSHGPYSVGKDMQYKLQDNNYEELNDFPFAYYSMAFSLQEFAKWLQWMQQNGIYDNTKIILTSDHGWWLSTLKSNYTSGVSNWDNVKRSGPDEDLYLEQGIVTSLLMVKDFNVRGELQYDDRPMISSDLPYLTYDKIPDAKQIYQELQSVRKSFSYAFVNSAGDYTSYNLGVRYDIRYDEQQNVLYYREKLGENSFGSWRVLLSYHGKPEE